MLSLENSHPFQESQYRGAPDIAGAPIACHYRIRCSITLLTHLAVTIGDITGVFSFSRMGNLPRIIRPYVRDWDCGKKPRSFSAHDFLRFPMALPFYPASSDHTWEIETVAKNRGHFLFMISWDFLWRCTSSPHHPTIRERLRLWQKTAAIFCSWFLEISYGAALDF